jgi:FlaA1/EpsC-like NDP-sugar epimerase
VPRIADVCDSRAHGAGVREFRPRWWFHAAAHKHVPMMEWNPGEAIKNNVFGTRSVADLADRHGVEQFVMISTDKAVNPTSIMGAPSAWPSSTCQALAAALATRVRHGALRQRARLQRLGGPHLPGADPKGGPVTVTHPEMKRYFMTIPEASQLVLQAGAMGEGGEIFVLDMGEPVKIVDLARGPDPPVGAAPGEDIEIQFTGIRPGEKLFEELEPTRSTPTRRGTPRSSSARRRRPERARPPGAGVPRARGGGARQQRRVVGPSGQMMAGRTPGGVLRVGGLAALPPDR